MSGRSSVRTSGGENIKAERINSRPKTKLTEESREAFNQDKKSGRKKLVWRVSGWRKVEWRGMEMV